MAVFFGLRMRRTVVLVLALTAVLVAVTLSWNQRAEAAGLVWSKPNYCKIPYNPDYRVYTGWVQTADKSKTYLAAVKWEWTKALPQYRVHKVIGREYIDGVKKGDRTNDTFAPAWSGTVYLPPAMKWLPRSSFPTAGTILDLNERTCYVGTSAP